MVIKVDDKLRADRLTQLKEADDAVVPAVAREGGRAPQIVPDANQ